MAVRVKRKTNMKGLGCENGITLYENAWVREMSLLRH